MKVTLKDGRTATLSYVGATEEERTQSAIDVTFIEEAMGRLQNRGDLTPTLQDVLMRCRDMLIIVTPDTQQPPANDDLMEPSQQPAQPQTTQQRRGRTPVV